MNSTEAATLNVVHVTSQELEIAPDIMENYCAMLWWDIPAVIFKPCISTFSAVVL